MLFLLFIVLLLTIVYYKIKKSHQYWEERGVKTLKPTFFFGNSASSTFGKESIYQELLNYYKHFPNERYMGVYYLTKPVLLIRDPDLIKSMLIKDFDHFVNHRVIVPTENDPLWSKNLFFLQDAKWKTMRSTLSPSFTSSKIRNMFFLIMETVDVYMKYLSTNKISKIEIRDTFSRFTNDVIASVAFGIQCDSINNKNNEFYAMAKGLTTVGYKEMIIMFISTLVPTLGNLLPSLSPKKVRVFFYEIITETIKVREEKGIQRPDMISLLLEEKKHCESEMGNQLTNEDIIAQAFIFLFAGFETVSNTLTFTVYELTRNPEVQAKLQEEIDSVLQDNGKLTYESLMKMKYIDQVISETLRLWVPALGGDRECTKPYTIEPVNPSEKKFVIQPGDSIWVPMNGIHRDPEYFPDPDVFNPERFSDENKGNINPYTFLPFGLGPRTCIGMRLALMEVKAFLFNMLSKYTLVATTMEPAKISATTFDLKLEEDVVVELRPRN